MSSPVTVNVITKEFGYGLNQDARIIVDLLNESGFEAKLLQAEPFSGGGVVGKIKTSSQRLGHVLARRIVNRQPKRDINIFLEQLPNQMFPAAHHQVLIPNQEWFRGEQEKYLKEVDLVVCKTQVAVEVFSKRSCPTAFSSFTSIDRRISTPTPKLREFLMVAGHALDVAKPVLDLWARHPEWPRLTLSGRAIPADGDLPNVRLMRDFVDAAEIIRLQNENLFHLCISPAEGFGHKFNEAFSCGAIVIATDAPPMNEIVQPDRGLLVKWNRSNPQRLGTEYHFDPANLEKTIEKALRLTPQETASLTANGRSWFEANDNLFKTRLPAILRDLMSQEA